MASTSSSPPSSLHVAFIGLGAMGFAMSTHLVRQGVSVTGYDIYGPTLTRWQKTCDDEIPGSKATTASSPAEAVKSANVVCLMVANHHHVHSALFDDKVGAVHGLERDCTVIIHATIPPTQPAEVRQRLDDEFGRKDVKLIDAPVSGGTARSINGTLTIMASSDNPQNLTDPNVDYILTNLASKGATLYAIPGGLGNGESAKALNQVMCGIHIVAASEIMGLAAINGLDTQAFYDQLVSTDTTEDNQHHQGWSWMFENRGPRMLSATPPLASATSIIDKDVNIIRAEETRLSITLPLLDRASTILTAVMKTHAAADDSVIVQHYLGLSSDNKSPSLVVDQAGRLLPGGSQQGQEMASNALATAHAMIHLNSAFETVQFAKALDLMGPEQRRMWFAIIAGAAGGSTTFAEVMPSVLGLDDTSTSDDAGTKGGAKGQQQEPLKLTVESSFREYAKRKFGGEEVDRVTTIVSDAKKSGYEPVLLEAAVEFVKTLLR